MTTFLVDYNGSRFAYLGNGFSRSELVPNMGRAHYIREWDRGSSLFRNFMSNVTVSEPMGVKAE